MLKKLLGILPQKNSENIYKPSPFALKIATTEKTNYSPIEFELKYKGSKKIAMICTEDDLLEMKNGKHFKTGNHPVEMFLPMLHLNNAGFDFDIFTPTGKPVKVEMWAMPNKDENVKRVYEKYQEKLQNPEPLNNIINNNNYVALFIPGGHGALLNLPFNNNLNNILHWAKSANLHILTICHGPAALLAAKPTQKTEDFIFKNFKIAAFPDLMDKITPLFGYMPGQLKWKFGKELKELGVEIINSKADNTCYVDRNLISGASPDAANDFGILAAKELLKKHNL